MVSAARILPPPPTNKENRRIGRKIFVFMLTMFLLILSLSIIGYILYFMLSYTEYPLYKIINDSVVASDEYLGKRDTLTAFGIIAIIVLALAIIYHGLLNYLKD